MKPMSQRRLTFGLALLAFLLVETNPATAADKNHLRKQKPQVQEPQSQVDEQQQKRCLETFSQNRFFSYVYLPTAFVGAKGEFEKTDDFNRRAESEIKDIREKTDKHLAQYMTNGMLTFRSPVHQTKAKYDADNETMEIDLPSFSRVTARDILRNSADYRTHSIIEAKTKETTMSIGLNTYPTKVTSYYGLAYSVSQKGRLAARLDRAREAVKLKMAPSDAQKIKPQLVYVFGGKPIPPYAITDGDGAPPNMTHYDWAIVELECIAIMDEGSGRVLYQF